MYENIKPLKVNIISDIHYYAREMGCEGKEYTATLDGEEIAFNNDNGCLEFTLNSKFKDTHTIIIKEK